MLVFCDFYQLYLLFYYSIEHMVCFLSFNPAKVPLNTFLYKNYNKTLFSSEIASVLLIFAILSLQQCCWPRPAGILPVIPFCERSAKQKNKTKRRFINSMFFRPRSTVVVNTCHSFCRHSKKVFTYSPTKNYIFRNYNFFAGRIFQNF